MSRDRYIALGLQDSHRPSTGLTDALRPVVDRALVVLIETIRAGDVADAAALAEIERLRQVLMEATEPEAIEQASRELFALCETTLLGVAVQRSVREAEISSLVSLVREAVTTIAGDNHRFDSSLDQSTARFEAMAQCNDLRQLKLQLAAEVTTLKKIAVERQQSWESTVKVFETRVASLEQQLVSTRMEAALDQVTQIANRRTFDHTCAQWLQSDRQFVLALLDLDDFKLINDTHGHAAGDKVLLEVARALKGALRASDLVARFGGDEFVVLMTGVTLRMAEGRLKTVAGQLAKASVVADAERGITVSCGIAEFSAGDTVDSLVARADQALYDAKRRGKNRVAVKAQTFIRDLLNR